MVTTHAQLPCEPRLGSIRALPPCPPAADELVGPAAGGTDFLELPGAQ